jgi:hypothetical protein
MIPKNQIDIFELLEKKIKKNKWYGMVGVGISYLDIYPPF